MDNKRVSGTEIIEDILGQHEEEEVTESPNRLSMNLFE